MAIVSEMSELSVVSFETDKTLYIPGETITVTAKIKNISGTAIKVWSVGIGIDARQFTDDSRAAWYTYPVGGPVTQVSISWAAGATKSFTWAITLDGNALSPFLRYGVRAVPLVMDLVSGTADNLASDTYVSDSVYVINARFNPTIEAFNFARAIDGVPDDEGTNLLTTLKISQAEYADNYIFNPVCRIQYVPQDGSAEASTIDLTDQIPALITGVTGDASIIADEFSTGLGYDFVIVFGDEYENTMGATDVDRAFANFAQSETGRGVAVGMFPTSTQDEAKFESAYPGYMYAGVNTFGGGELCTNTQRAMGVQSGQVAQQGNVSGGAYRDTEVTFEMPYAEGTIPTVVAGFRTSSSAASFGHCVCSVTGVTNTGFTIRFYNGDDSNRNPGFNWIAIGVM